MKHQKGSSLVVALIFLTIISLVAVYSLEGSNIQSKMVANSLFSSLTYQECRNEQEANIRYYNIGSNSSEFIVIAPGGSGSTITTAIRSNATAKSDLNVSWVYMGPQGIGSNSGESVETGSPSTSLVFENNCIATFRFSTNSQTIGVRAKTLQLTGKVI